ncbi:hypothetical protein L2E82_02641 [Cichorium intybus]|uniref:Uncharacterized protein n=1 Tax=Cichorium intybus TaxID=13427 RepID=A0ACB9H4D7_CICIN|nr:hypothetical protein L2E82_02641 [Cichorium intybus]
MIQSWCSCNATTDHMCSDCYFTADVWEQEGIWQEVDNQDLQIISNKARSIWCLSMSTYCYLEVYELENYLEYCMLVLKFKEGPEEIRALTRHSRGQIAMTLKGDRMAFYTWQNRVRKEEAVKLGVGLLLYKVNFSMWQPVNDIDNLEEEVSKYSVLREIMLPNRGKALLVTRILYIVADARVRHYVSNGNEDGLDELYSFIFKSLGPIYGHKNWFLF